MGKYFAIVNEETGTMDADSHLCYCGNDSDMDIWQVKPGYRLVELKPEEYSALTVLDIKANRDGKDVVIQAEEITDKDQIQVVKKYDLDATKLEKYIEDRPLVDVPIEVEGPGGKEIIGVEQKPDSIIKEKGEEIEIITAKKK